MIRYLLIISLILCKSVFAEIIEIDKGVKLKIPENKKYYTTNTLEDFKRNMETAKFTSKEIKYSLNEIKKMGFTGNELGYSIVSETRYKNKLRQEDEFEKLEYDLEQQEFVISKCSQKKNKKN